MNDRDKFDDEFDRMIEKFMNMMHDRDANNPLNFPPEPNMNSKDLKSRSGRTPDGGYFEESTWTTPDGSSTYSSVTYSSLPFGPHRSQGNKSVNVDAEKNFEAHVKQMEAALKQCVEKEDFEKAAKLRDAIKHLKSIEPKFKKLRNQLIDAVKKEDFEKAQDIKIKIQKLLTPKK